VNHIDRLYQPDQPKDWLGNSYTFADARTDLLSNWRVYADQFFQNHYACYFDLSATTGEMSKALDTLAFTWSSQRPLSERREGGA